MCHQERSQSGERWGEGGEARTGLGEATLLILWQCELGCRECRRLQSEFVVAGMGCVGRAARKNEGVQEVSGAQRQALVESCPRCCLMQDVSQRRVDDLVKIRDLQWAARQESHPAAAKALNSCYFQQS